MPTAVPTDEIAPGRRDRTVDYPFFDYLRFVLAALVCLYHQGITGDLPAGNFAVQAFFALSGWLIGGVLLRTSRSDLPHFFYNRVTRIWAPYAAAVVALYALALAVGRGGEWPRFLLYDLTFTHNWFVGPASPSVMPLDGTGGHFWSIAVEEQFYLVAPLVLLLLPGGRKPLVWAFVAFMAFALAPGYFAAISLGVLAAVGRQVVGDWHLSTWAQVTLGVVLAACAGVGLALPSTYAFFAPIAAACLVLLLARPGRRTAPATFVGGISYPFYLNHWMGLFVGNALVGATGVPEAVGHVIAFIAAVTAGVCAYLIIDRPVLQRRNRLYRRGLGIACMLAAYSLMVLGFTLGLLLAPGEFPNVTPGAIR